ncbi:hypothetical protein [Cellulosimicrobium sp. CpK407]|uniref:hypothetical protein n=1 Tax=Cellulosimicrobium sp. CpK407 TaxID=3229847 RepID=UPI003F2DD6B1
MSTTPTESGRVHRLRWSDPALAGLGPRSRLAPVGLVVLAVAITLVDVLVMYPAVARSMGHDPVMTWLTALGLGLVALLTAGVSGWTWRGATGNHPGSWAPLLLPVLLLAAWAALALLLMRLRLQVSDVATTVAYEGAVPQPAESGFDALAAGVFLAVYVLCGLLTFGDLYHWRNDAYTAGRRAVAELTACQDELTEHEASYQHLLANHHKRTAEIDRLAADAIIATTSNAAFAAELEQLVRQEIAVGLGDPATTGITSPRHPSNPFGQRARGRREEQA